MYAQNYKIFYKWKSETKQVPPRRLLEAQLEVWPDTFLIYAFEHEHKTKRQTAHVDAINHAILVPTLIISITFLKTIIKYNNNFLSNILVYIHLSLQYNH